MGLGTCNSCRAECLQARWLAGWLAGWLAHLTWGLAMTPLTTMPRACTAGAAGRQTCVQMHHLCSSCSKQCQQQPARQHLTITGAHPHKGRVCTVLLDGFQGEDAGGGGGAVDQGPGHHARPQLGRQRHHVVTPPVQALQV